MRMGAGSPRGATPRQGNLPNVLARSGPQASAIWGPVSDCARAFRQGDASLTARPAPNNANGAPGWDQAIGRAVLSGGVAGDHNVPGAIGSTPRERIQPGNFLVVIWAEAVI